MGDEPFGFQCELRPTRGREGGEHGSWSKRLGDHDPRRPLLLVTVIAWAALRNRSSRASRDETEIATRELYREEDMAHRGEDDRGP